LVQTWIDVHNNAPQGVITTGFLEQFLVSRNLLSTTKKLKSKRIADDQLKRRVKKPKDIIDTPDKYLYNENLLPTAPQTPHDNTYNENSLPTAPQTPQKDSSQTLKVHPDVMAAASDIMQIVIFNNIKMERTPPKKRSIISRNNSIGSGKFKSPVKDRNDVTEKSMYSPIDSRKDVTKKNMYSPTDYRNDVTEKSMYSHIDSRNTLTEQMSPTKNQNAITNQPHSSSPHHKKNYCMSPTDNYYSPKHLFPSTYLPPLPKLTKQSPSQPHENLPFDLPLIFQLANQMSPSIFDLTSKTIPEFLQLETVKWYISLIQAWTDFL
jgi:hypothetical protein